MTRVTLQMRCHRLCWCGFVWKWGMGAQVMIVVERWTWSSNMNHWFLWRTIFGSTHVEYSHVFLWELCRMIGMGQPLFHKESFVFVHVLQHIGCTMIGMYFSCFSQGFNLDTSHLLLFSAEQTTDSTLSRTRRCTLGPWDRDLKHQSNSNCLVYGDSSIGLS